MGRSLILTIALFASLTTAAQELNCSVNINATQIQTSDRNIFRDMKQSIEQFMNSRKWSNDNYKPHEKIACNLLITITKMPSIGTFTASVQIQSARPIYNSNYSSLVFNFADREWEFEYIESLPLEFNDNVFTSNLTSMLAFYAYMILGVDHDTFSELGGTPYYQRAQQVVIAAQNSGHPGWTALGSNRNRYWISENFINSQMVDLRKALYSYHRLALDNFEAKPDEGRETILKALRDIKKLRDINPNAIIIISFFDAKGKELADIFSTGNLQARREAYDIMTTIDPSNRSMYEKMVRN